MIKLLKEIKKLNKNLEKMNTFPYKEMLKEKLKFITKLYNKSRKDDYSDHKGNYTDVSLKLEGQKELLQEMLKELD